MAEEPKRALLRQVHCPGNDPVPPATFNAVVEELTDLRGVFVAVHPWRNLVPFKVGA